MKIKWQNSLILNKKLFINNHHQNNFSYFNIYNILFNTFLIKKYKKSSTFFMRSDDKAITFTELL